MQQGDSVILNAAALARLNKGKNRARDPAAIGVLGTFDAVRKRWPVTWPAGAIEFFSETLLEVVK